MADFRRFSYDHFDVRQNLPVHAHQPLVHLHQLVQLPLQLSSR
jgi:hypothetical protein